jgi:hypothetical protein
LDWRQAHHRPCRDSRCRFLRRLRQDQIRLRCHLMYDLLMYHRPMGHLLMWWRPT